MRHGFASVGYRAVALGMACLLAVGAGNAARAQEDSQKKAMELDARRAQEAFARSNRVFKAWYAHRGKNNKLLPDNLGCRVWRPENAAADLWSFFVIAGHLTDREALRGDLSETLRDEIRLTTRLGRLPDHFHIDNQAFTSDEPDVRRIIFGASEYVKDGLLPMAELMGRTVWFERARGLLDDIFEHAPVQTRFGNIPSTGAEVNGEMLQSLCRFYFATGDERYKRWAERIGDAYFLEILPKNNDLPCHDWDFAAGKPRNDLLSLSDHGNEIVFGLAEIVALEHACDAQKEKEYLPPMRRMIDKLLEIAVNEHGLWVRSLKSSTGKVRSRSTPDTWGYALNAVYTLYMVTGEERYREAVRRALRGINADPKYRDWGGADAFADSIESGIVLLNRMPEPEGLKWLEATVPAFLAKQRADGIVEGWHGDGNYVRTALMYALMKTRGCYVTPWREDVLIGAAETGKGLNVSLKSEEPWKGVLRFDYPRHRIHLGLSMNYPRLNEFPEWYTVEPALLYVLTMKKEQEIVLGSRLIEGVEVEVGESGLRIGVEPLAGPPYGGRVLSIEAPSAYGGDGPFRIPFTVRNRTDSEEVVVIVTSFGSIDVETPECVIPAGGEVKLELRGDLKESVTAVIAAFSPTMGRVSREIRLVHGENITGLAAFDDQTYKERGYLWTGRGPIELTLPARQGKSHTLKLLWGAKKDKRAAVVTVNGKQHRLAKGGYDGFEWLELAIPGELVTGDSISVTIIEDAERGRGAFISEAILTCP